MRVLNHNNRTLSNEDYYYLSRCRYWSVENLIQLFFNDPLLKVPPKSSPQEKFVSLIEQAIKSSDLPTYPTTKITRWSETLRCFLSPFKEGIRDEKEYEFYETRLLAYEAYIWARCKKTKGFQSLPEFMNMGEEISPSDFQDQIYCLKAWSIPNLIRVIFGEKHKNWPECLENSTVKNFVEVIEADISTGNLKPLTTPINAGDIKDLKFQPISFIGLIASPRIQSWLKNNCIDILGWVEELFNTLEKDFHELRQPRKQQCKNQSRKGRPSFPYSPQFIKAVKAKAEQGIPEKSIPFYAEVTSTFAKNATNRGKTITEKEYKKAYGWTLRIVRKNVEKALSE